MTAVYPIPDAAVMAKVTAFFAAGTLAGKLEEAQTLRSSGATMLFEGAVRWRLLLVDEDLVMKGTSPSLDDAFGDMASSMRLLQESHDDASELLCSVEMDD